MLRNPYYSTYYINLAVLFVLGVIPVSLLAYFNCVIYLKIKPPTILLHTEDSVGGSTSRISSCTSAHEKDLARVLIGIVIMFILCHILRLLINFYETIVIRNAIACESAGMNDFPLWGFITITCSELLLVFNSSLNMIIYCCINQNFRKRVLFWKDYVRSGMAPNKENKAEKKETIKMDNLRHFSISSEGIDV